MTNTHFLSPQKVKICRKEGALWLKMDGQKMKLDPPRRAIPLSLPDEFIVLSDRNGNEIGVIRRLIDIAPESREVLQHALDAEYEVTIITRVLDVEREPLSGQVRWRVEVRSEVDEEVGENELVRNGPRLLKRLGRRSKVERSESADDPTFVHHEKTFSIAGAEDVQTSRYPRIFITDTEGNRYEIENCEELDLASRRIGERYF